MDTSYPHNPQTPDLPETPVPATPNAPEHPEGTEETPFLIELHRREQTPGGYFRPAASLTITPALRTCGLLQALPAEEVKSLLFLFTFLSPNGWCRPSVPELAEAMRLSEAKVRARMARLAAFSWLGRPLVTEVRRESGLDAFVPAPTIVAVREAPQQPVAPEVPLYRAAGREAVIAHSRAHYARPRAQVEQEIAEMMGWKEEGDSPEATLRRRLLSVGLLREQVDLLLAQFPQERIARQLEWLPYRNAKNPAALLVAAIEGDYEAPLPVRMQAAAAAAEYESEDHEPEPQEVPSDEEAALPSSGTDEEPVEEEASGSVEMDGGALPASPEEPPTSLTLP